MCYPFEVNYELGNLHVEMFQPIQALEYYDRSFRYAELEDEHRNASEGKARALELIISSTRNQIDRFTRDPGKTQKVESYEKLFSSIRQEYDSTLSTAIRYWRKVDPKNRKEFAAIHFKIFELITKQNESNNVWTAKEFLEESAYKDNEFRDFPLYILLGNVNLHLAYDSVVTEQEKTKLITQATESFKKVFAYRFKREPGEFEYLVDWEFSDDISREDFETELLIKVCTILLTYPEYWRIIAGKSNDSTDSLEIYQRIQVAIESTEIGSEIRKELKIIQALAFLKKR